MFKFIILSLGMIKASLTSETFKFDEPQKMAIQGEYIGVSFSPDGKYLVLTKANYKGIYLYEFGTGKLITVTEDYGAGYRFSWDKEGKRITYKSSLKNNYQLFIYELQNRKTNILRPPHNLIGQPFFMQDGNIVVNYGGVCQILSSSGKLVKQIPEVNSNIIVATPDNKYLVYTDLDDRLWAYEIQTGAKIQLTPDGERYFSPIASPSSNLVVCNKLGGMITIVEVPSGKLTPLDTGDYFYFTPSAEYVIYTKTTDDGEKITSGEIYYCDLKSLKPSQIFLNKGIKLASAYHPARGLVYLTDTGKVFYAKIIKE